jgi:hypothetical protein
MDKAKRAQTAETLKQPSLRLTLRAPYLYPDRVVRGVNCSCRPTLMMVRSSCSVAAANFKAQAIPLHEATWRRFDQQ